MSISRCGVCDTEYDQDYHVEHEEECLTGDFVLETNQLIKMGVLTEGEQDKFLNELQYIYDADELEERIKSIKLDLSKREL